MLLVFKDMAVPDILVVSSRLVWGPISLSDTRGLVGTAKGTVAKVEFHDHYGNFSGVHLPVSSTPARLVPVRAPSLKA